MCMYTEQRHSFESFEEQERRNTGAAEKNSRRDLSCLVEFSQVRTQIAKDINCEIEPFNCFLICNKCTDTDTRAHTSTARAGSFVFICCCCAWVCSRTRRRRRVFVSEYESDNEDSSG